MGPRRQERMARLLQFAHTHVTWTQPDLARKFGWSLNLIERAIQDLRLAYADVKTVNLVCDPDGVRRPWKYRLVFAWSETRRWAMYRLVYVLTSLRVIAATTDVLALATKAGTPEGDIARMIQRNLRATQKGAARIVAKYDGTP